MILRSLQLHMRGQKVNVCGTLYDIDEEGLCEVRNSEHAERLLQFRHGWERVHETEPKVKEVVPETPPEPTIKKSEEKRGKSKRAAPEVLDLMRRARAKGLSVIGKSQEQLAKELADLESSEAIEDSGDDEDASNSVQG